MSAPTSSASQKLEGRCPESWAGGSSAKLLRCKILEQATTVKVTACFCQRSRKCGSSPSEPSDSCGLTNFRRSCSLRLAWTFTFGAAVASSCNILNRGKQCSLVPCCRGLSGELSRGGTGDTLSPPLHPPRPSRIIFSIIRQLRGTPSSTHPREKGTESFMATFNLCDCALEGPSLWETAQLFWSGYVAFRFAQHCYSAKRKRNRAKITTMALRRHVSSLPNACLGTRPSTPHRHNQPQKWKSLHAGSRTHCCSTMQHEILTQHMLHSVKQGHGPHEFITLIRAHVPARLGQLCHCVNKACTGVRRKPTRTHSP